MCAFSETRRAGFSLGATSSPCPAPAHRAHRTRTKRTHAGCLPPPCSARPSGPARFPPPAKRRARPSGCARRGGGRTRAARLRACSEPSLRMRFHTPRSDMPVTRPLDISIVRIPHRPCARPCVPTLRQSARLLPRPPCPDCARARATCCPGPVRAVRATVASALCADSADSPRDSASALCADSLRRLRARL